MIIYINVIQTGLYFVQIVAILHVYTVCLYCDHLLCVWQSFIKEFQYYYYYYYDYDGDYDGDYDYEHEEYDYHYYYNYHYNLQFYLNRVLHLQLASQTEPSQQPEQVWHECVFCRPNSCAVD